MLIMLHVIYRRRIQMHKVTITMLMVDQKDTFQIVCQIHMRTKGQK